MELNRPLTTFDDFQIKIVMAEVDYELGFLSQLITEKSKKKSRSKSAGGDASKEKLADVFDDPTVEDYALKPVLVSLP